MSCHSIMTRCTTVLLLLFWFHLLFWLLSIIWPWSGCISVASLKPEEIDHLLGQGDQGCLLWRYVVYIPRTPDPTDFVETGSYTMSDLSDEFYPNKEHTYCCLCGAPFTILSYGSPGYDWLTIMMTLQIKRHSNFVSAADNRYIWHILGIRCFHHWNDMTHAQGQPNYKRRRTVQGG